MLGGQYIQQQDKLVIALAVPCNSISTGLQCEMDPGKFYNYFSSFSIYFLFF